MADRTTPTPDEQRIRAALHGLAAAPGAPDEHAAWEAVQSRMERSHRLGRRRGLVALTSAAAAAAAIVAVATLTGGDDPERVEVGPVDTPTTIGDAPTTEPTSVTSVPPTGFPARPLAVVVHDDGESRLDLIDADSGAVVTQGLARSAHSISSVSFGPDGTVYFTEEFGDSSTVRVVPWDGSAEPVTPFGAGNETSSPALSPDGRTFAYVHQGVTTDGREVVLVDTQTGEQRALRWAPDEEDFFLTNGSLHGLEWSPDGSRLLFVVSYEGSEPMVLDATAESLSEAEPVADLFAYQVHWAGNEVLVGLHFCCYPEFDEPPEVRWAELGGAVTPTEGTGAPVAFDVDPTGVLALVREDGTVQLLDLDTGSSTEISLDLPALDVGF